MRSPVFSLRDDRPTATQELRDALSSREFLVVGLCAAWCDTCTEFAEIFAAIALERSDATFVWLDIEDDATVAGDIDVENFPTLAVYQGDRLVHFGPSLPLKNVVLRLLGSLSESSPAIAADAQVLRLRGVLSSSTPHAN